MTKSKLPRKVKQLMDQFAKELRVPERKAIHPIVVAPVGPSRSGKTTVMTYVASRLGLVHVQSDCIRLFLRRHGLNSGKYINRYGLIFCVGERFLKLGYGVVLDANFASDPSRVLQARHLAKKYGGQFFLVRVKSSQGRMIRVLKKIKYPDKGGLFLDAQTAIAHLTRSAKQFDYKTLEKRAVVKVNPFKPLGPQLAWAIWEMRQAQIRPRP